MKNLKEKKGPLRRVLFTAMLAIEDPAQAGREGRAYREAIQEVYECGHAFPQKSDIYGPTNAYRRRCRACRDGKPPMPGLKSDVERFLRKEAEGKKS